MGIIVPTKVVMEDVENAPEIDIEELRARRESDILLIVGDGDTAPKDLEEFMVMTAGIPDYPGHEAMLINWAWKFFPYRYQHYVAGDSHKAVMQNAAARQPPGVLKHCWNPLSRNFDIRWLKTNRTGWTGTTANLGVQVAISLGYLKLVFIGIPMTYTGHWYDKWLPENDMKRSSDHRHHLWKWVEMACRPYARLIRSMSGKTRELFGEPDPDWLMDLPD